MAGAADPTSGAKRVDIISDTHGYLAPALLDALEGADLIIHAGDITSEADWEHLRTIAPIKAVLGNNDHYYEYGPEVVALNRFSFEGLEFAVAHYREDLPVGSVDIAVCGHTHRARIVELGRTTVINPGSASYPRGMRGPTIARLLVADGRIRSLEIIDL
ncbi:YfcE family phosphodiesterase [Collinsella vaginalis]|uniref:YfcE family phosphodiesterase n=1 Tax=Collinsella vaginalis TaxID=1870987 RepID=UPI000A26EA97|nr:YfcE family phosphodiesterase [Collinsella vaginalis]